MEFKAVSASKSKLLILMLFWKFFFNVMSNFEVTGRKRYYFSSKSLNFLPSLFFSTFSVHFAQLLLLFFFALFNRYDKHPTEALNHCIPSKKKKNYIFIFWLFQTTKKKNWWVQKVPLFSIFLSFFFFFQD